MDGLEDKMNKVYKDALSALEGLTKDGITIMSGGFGLCGIPENSIAALNKLGVQNLNIIANTCGVDGFGLGILVDAKQVKHVTTSYMGENKEFGRQYLAGEIEVEFTPQGTLAERIRAGGAGIPAFYTKTGVGTVVAEGKEHKIFNGETYILERALRADIAIIKAWRADEEGNLVYRKTTQNFNPQMATAATITIAEVEEIVPCGEIDPDHIHTPGIYIDRIFKGSFEKRIEKRTFRKREAITEIA